MGRRECPHYQSFPWEYGGRGIDEECHAPGYEIEVGLDLSPDQRLCNYEGKNHCDCPIYQKADLVQIDEPLI